MKWKASRLVERRFPRRFSIPVKKLEFDKIAGREVLCFLGHNTVWLSLKGKSILFDPIFGTIGGVMRRRIPAPILPEELPPVDLVLVSHAHRDHLDLPSLKRLPGSPRIVLPLGAGRYLRGNGSLELDWLSESLISGVRVVSLPVQHWAQRGLFDYNTSLWTGYLVEIDGLRLFFGGDTGYFEGFKEIGEEFGPFDLALLPCGAYEPRSLMAPFHMNPEEAVQAALDLKARLAIPIHWGAYLLGDEPPHEPPQRFLEEARSRGLPARVLYPGDFFEP
ncbi:MBL fold metallo-hydrolase [Thermosulfurimonas dismutans]|uniref:Outer membrane protein romA n=1 Tax=Thermosulfurimonas dismutans TaxID=999894 RepID=A0A179D3Q8_9BACT|nr:MBL fold metallo-hydrolase [Thermosulfurimonas dismutans]OAQ20676.1 Outer membrane protein romA [Thermosulfurimonas dismutans]